MNKEKRDKNFVKKPYYEGGTKAMRAFLKQHLKYPAEALKARIEGTVVIKYSIDHHGKVVEAKVISGLGYGCDEEAVRLAKLLRFKVAKSRGVKVLFQKDLQIHFRLPKAPSTAIQYVYSNQKEAAPQEETNDHSGGYTYTITIG
jgi:protein TonB